MHRSTAWPLTLLCVLLIGQATLHPFGPWTLPAVNWHHWPQLLKLPHMVATPFDVISNVCAYIPLGFLCCLAWARSQGHWAVAGLLAVLGSSLLSYGLEFTQHFIPSRVPSVDDWIYNTAGAAAGALLALVLNALGAVEYVKRWRQRWLLGPGSRTGQTLLLVWCMGLFFPAWLPLAQGQVWPPLSQAISAALAHTPWAAWAPPVLDPVTVAFREEPSFFTQSVYITLSLLGPVAVSFVMTRAGLPRLIFLLLILLSAAGLGTLSTLLHHGPEHSTSWITPPVWPAFGLAAAIGSVWAWMPRRLVAVLGIMALTASLIWVNQQSPFDPFYSQRLALWDGGRFVRLFGLSQWSNWCWPYLGLVWLGVRLVRAR